MKSVRVEIILSFITFFAVIAANSIVPFDDYEKNISSFPADYPGLYPFVSSIKRSDPEPYPPPTSAASVDFVARFSESVTGVNVDDFELATTGTISGASILTVSELGDVYTITVNSGTGIGTIRLDLLDNDSIVDGESNPLGGPGTGNGDFTNGEVYEIERVPATLTVTKTEDSDDGVCDSDCSLREAVTTAVSGSTILFDPSLAGQTIALSSTITIEKDLTIDGSILSPYVQISGNNMVRVFRVSNSVSNDVYVHLSGLIIMSGNASFESGGGIANYSDGLSLLNVTLSNNAAYDGGGMYNYSSNPSLVNVTFNANRASNGDGGGMYNFNSSPTLKDVTFTGNITVTDFSRGGGMFNFEDSNPDLMSVIFSGNSANAGGGMWNEHSSPSLVNVTFSNNIADSGGGMFNDSSSSPSLTNVTFSNNIAKTYQGGGMWNAGSCNPNLVNVSFSGNSANYLGGAMLNGGAPTLTNVTISGNSANQEGGGIYNVGDSSPTIRNSILWGNTAPTGAQIYNENGEPNISYSVIQGGYADGTHIVTDDPLLGTLGNYGGFTKTIPISSDSSAINAGNDFYCPDVDQRGVERPQGPHCDIGAYEYDHDPSPVVLSITRASGNPTDASSVTFTVTFSEAVTGVDKSDFSLTTSGLTAPAITSVTGSGATRTVTVNTGSGNGTIRLNVIDNDTIVDANGTPLAGSGAGNGSFTSGETYTVQKHNADTTGVFRPGNGLLYLKNSNTTGFADVAINYGLGGDYPVVGDWNGDGTATIGVYRNGSFYLRNSNTLGYADLVFPFGTPGDQPIAGDWDGDGVDTIGIFRPSTGLFLLRNSNTAGAADMSFYLGNVGDVGIAGDWDGDGIDTTGVFRPSNGVIFLKNTNSTGFADVALNYGIPGDRPVTGDWDADGVDTIGVYRNGVFMLRNSNTVGFADIVFGLGNPGDMPIAGDWNGLP